ncbi:unnamed protein product [Cunninghamella blakesleeana]
MDNMNDVTDMNDNNSSNSNDNSVNDSPSNNTDNDSLVVTPTEISDENDLDIYDESMLLDGNLTSQPLTEEQLQEVFKRTSAFTVRGAMMDETAMDEMNDMELWQIEFNDGNTEEFYEEDDYIHVDDDFWDLEFGESPRKKGRKGVGLRTRATREPSSPKQRFNGVPRNDRDRILEKYKILQVQVQNRDGTFYTVKQRVSMIDPSLPTYIRIPGEPIPRSWVHTILQLEDVDSEKPILGSRVYKVKKITELDLTTFGKKFAAVYMDPPLLLPGEEPSPGKLHVDELAKLDIGGIVPAGFLFIWTEKEWIRHFVRMAQGWGFKYVENFCWIQKNLNNQISKRPSAYVRKSKLTLLMFKKDGLLEIRHQRNPDCIFDFVRPPVPGELTETKPAFVYKLMETLLPCTDYHPIKNPNGGRCLELWGKRDHKRTSWTTIIEDRLL